MGWMTPGLPGAVRPLMNPTATDRPITVSRALTCQSNSPLKAWAVIPHCMPVRFIVTRPTVMATGLQSSERVKERILSLGSSDFSAHGGFGSPAG